MTLHHITSHHMSDQLEGYSAHDPNAPVTHTHTHMCMTYVHTHMYYFMLVERQREIRLSLTSSEPIFADEVNADDACISNLVYTQSLCACSVSKSDRSSYGDLMRKPVAIIVHTCTYRYTQEKNGFIPT